MNRLGATTRIKALDMIRFGERAKAGRLITETNRANVIIEKQPYQGNEAFLNEIKGLRQDVQNIPDNKMEFDKWLRFTKLVSKKGNKTTTDFYPMK